MTPAQIKKAEQLLAKKKEMLTLFDRNGSEQGYISYKFVDNDASVKRVPVLSFSSTIPAVTLDTLEKWIKQAKKAHKLGII